MENSELLQQIQELSTHELPNPNTLINEGHQIADGLTLGLSLFCEAMGVKSEADYKAQRIRDGSIMYHAHIGMGSWPATADALHTIYKVAQDEGYQIDRAGICLDRRMAVPAEYRENIPSETGPMLTTDEEWRAVGHTIPIQPHMGDFMIGFPAATRNTVNALRAGVTTIGNLSQYFSHEAPRWSDPITTIEETVRSIAILGQRRRDGLMLHSYLEDGYGALFQDCATIAGWAYLERYIVEELLGARLTHCIGGLTSDPVKRVGWVFAFKEIHDGDPLGSMIYGDTISFTGNFPRNWGVVGEYLLWDILAQLECPTGHAVHPLPITEAIRIPSAEEIAEIHTFGRQIEAAARRMHSAIDFSPAREFSRKIVKAGKSIFNRAIDGLKDNGVDIDDPVQLLFVLKNLGPYHFESLFGIGEWAPKHQRRKPLIPTDIFQQSLETVEYFLPEFSTEKMKALLLNKHLLLASTDVHEHALFVLHELLHQAGAKIINLGAEQNPFDVAKAVQSNNVDAILISTHNGMALEYARQLQDELKERCIDVPVLIGGVLNQKMENTELPVDVRNELHKLGFQTNTQLETGWGKLLPPGES
jgi:methylmalonyl-CoA mutase cobalamin-binding subunit